MLSVNDSATLPRDVVDQISALKDRVWSFGVSLDEMYAMHLQRIDSRPRRQTLLIRDGDTLLAHGEMFARDIISAGQTLTVGALAGVCVEPERQGQGLGRQIVRRAFASVDDGEYPLMLFQTSVVEFYQALGARVVKNRFFDSQAENSKEKATENPWWDDAVMIYPAAYDWSLGDIDLNGPGY